MLRFYYKSKYKYTNRMIIDLTNDTDYRDIDYENIDSPDTINGHIIYELELGESVPSYILDLESNKRWYVSGITQLRTGKYQISLIRDIISESEDWKNERAYIEAGTATDYCKYKLWGLPFTKTKVKQERLNINGKSSFFVFYANEQETESGKVKTNPITENDLVLKYSTSSTGSYDLDYDNISDIPGYEYINIGKFAYPHKKLGGFRIFAINGPEIEGTGWKSGKFFGHDFEGSETSGYESQVGIYRREDNQWYSLIHSGSKVIDYSGWIGLVRNNISNYINSLQYTKYDSSIPFSNVNETVIESLDGIVGKIIRIPVEGHQSQYKFYKIARNSIDNNVHEFLERNNQHSINIYNGLRSAGWDIISVSGNFALTEYTEKIREYTLVDLGTGTTCDFNLISSTNKLPKSNVRCVNIVSDGEVSDDLIMQSLMKCQTNAEAQGDNIGRIIDVQYLPFSVATSQNSNIKFGTYNAVAEFLTNDDFIYETNLPDLENINKETDSIMIVSPSRKSQFEFNPYNNDGNMEFSTRITIKPYQSVIYVRPSTKGLLMRDWDDKDCLIIQEDFSLTVTNSSWADYVYNNRNYQNAFNLQVQTKEYERSWERRIEQAQAKSDEWNARNISSQNVQTYTGNLPLISNIAGGIASAFKDNDYLQAAELDRKYNEALYQKSIDIAKEQYSYQIDNIKRQPLIPNTITAIDIKMLDGIYLEYYSTNNTELMSIENYYLYNGNRIDNYGVFSDYWGVFVKGKIILSSNYNQPELDELNRRLELGIFTGGII